MSPGPASLRRLTVGVVSRVSVRAEVTARG